MPPTTTKSPTPSEGAKLLQERLHELLSRLTATIEVVRHWPEQTKADDASIHVSRTTKLIASIRELVLALERVEGTLKEDQELRETLQSCPVPLDLLELMDHGGGLNPECFSRGLLKEAVGQLAGLKRRKLALELLGSAVQSRSKKGGTEIGGKREREEGTVQEPTAKRQNVGA